MGQFRDVSMEEMTKVEGGFLGRLVNVVNSVSTGIGSAVEKGVDQLRAGMYPPRPGTPVPCGSAPCPVPR